MLGSSWPSPPKLLNIKDSLLLYPYTRSSLSYRLEERRLVLEALFLVGLRREGSAMIWTSGPKGRRILAWEHQLMNFSLGLLA